MTRATKILIVDDRAENIIALKELLADSDVELISAQSGEEALSLILDHAFGLAILDVQMPHMSGFELAKFMRGTALSRHIPIIFVTASRAEKQRIFEGYEKGAVDFLLKPLIPHIVRSKVRIFVELDQAQQRLKNQLAEVERLKTVAEEANRTKSRFLANMSHEIRTPLGSIIGFAELLHGQQLSSQDRSDYIETIIRNGKHLTNLINDILDFSKIEAGRMEIEHIATDLDEVINDLQLTFEEAAKQKHTTLSFYMSPEVPRQVYTDPLRLRQIFTNLIGNAIKFTKYGRVAVYVSVVRPGAKPGSNTDEPTFLHCAVEDTGCGLTPDAVEHIFSPFAQGDSSTNRKFGGTGLGLSISQSLSTAMGGKLWLESTQLGKGSKFVFQVQVTPLPEALLLRGDAPAKSSHEPAIYSTNLDGIEVIAVDDIQDNLTLVEKFLSREKARVTCFTSGLQVIEELQKRLKRNEDLNSLVILLDIQMPEMDGYTTARNIRTLGYTGPLIALTAHAMKEERQRCIMAGCDDHICKPINLPKLLKTIHQTKRKLAQHNSDVPPPEDSSKHADAVPSLSSLASLAHAEPSGATINDVTHLPLQPLAETFSSMPAEMRNLIKSYISDTLPNRVNAMIDAANSRDYAAVARIGHELKGSVAVYQFPHIADLANRIERQAKESLDPSLIKKTILELQHVSLP